jgi:DNA-binding response OmpR family regulator
MASAHTPVILVVEDDPLAQDLLQDALTEEGYAVMLAADGATALAALETVVPDLVTLDMQLPGIDGVQLLELMRQRETLRDVNVVIVSGMDPLPDRAHDLAQAVVQKPFALDGLLAVVHRFVPPPDHAASSEDADGATGDRD